MIQYIRRKWNYYISIWKKIPTREVLLDEWLKYHNTSVNKIIKIHSKEVLESPDWFKLYSCTQKQADKWEKWAIKYLTKSTGYPQEYIERKWGFVYLDCVPYIKNNDK